MDVDAINDSSVRRTSIADRIAELNRRSSGSAPNSGITALATAKAQTFVPAPVAELKRRSSAPPADSGRKNSISPPLPVKRRSELALAANNSGIQSNQNVLPLAAGSVVVDRRLSSVSSVSVTAEGDSNNGQAPVSRASISGTNGGLLPPLAPITTPTTERKPSVISQASERRTLIDSAASTTVDNSNNRRPSLNFVAPDVIERRSSVFPDVSNSSSLSAPADSQNSTFKTSVVPSKQEDPARRASSTFPLDPPSPVTKTTITAAKPSTRSSIDSSTTSNDADELADTIHPLIIHKPTLPPPLPPRKTTSPPELALQQKPARRSSALDFIANAVGSGSKLRQAIVRARVDTIDNTTINYRERNLTNESITNDNNFRFRADSALRPSSARLSDADVSFLLGKVSKISGETLRQAARENNVELTEALIRGSVFVDDVDARGRTALMWAAKEASTDTAIHLIEMNSSLELKDENGMTAIAHAVENSRFNTFRALMECGADISSVDNEGRSLLTRALIKFDRSANPIPGTDGRNAFTQSAEICKALIKTSIGSAHSRENLQPVTNILLEEWFRAKQAAEPLVVPKFDDFLGGEQSLALFFKAQRKRVNIFAAIKVLVVLLFVGFDLYKGEIEMTPMRFILYVGAYYL